MPRRRQRGSPPSALKRSWLWDPGSKVDRRELPSIARLVMEQTAPPDKPPTEKEIAAGDEFVEDNYKTWLY
jgi:hypothetical protein